ncbi:MAG TPA: helix-turn-helix transcriptional regulator [Polyangiaceae bacterium]|nr:helix-turn-helix transcriptional regulator [Polyangiaceae bacterium]
MFRRPRHFHDEPEINLVVRGSARVGVGGQELVLGQGQAVVFQPGQDHELLVASEDLELYVVAVRPELAGQEPSLFACARGTAQLAAEQLVQVVRALQGLGQVSAADAVERGVVDVWSQVVACCGRPPVVARRAIAVLKEERSVPGDELARRLNTTPSELSRAFRRGFGLPMVEYRARLRLLEFVRLVDAGQDLTVAALNADFGSYAQCFRVFQRKLGCSPSEYFRGKRHELSQRLR